MICSRLKIVLLATILLTMGVAAQPVIDRLTPLKSEKADVIREFGNRSAGQNVYETTDGRIILTFYKSGCNSDIERDLKLSTDSLLEVKLIPKSNRSLSEVFSNQSSFASYSGHGGEKLFYDSNAGLVARTSVEEKDEAVRAIYRIPSKSNLKECLFQSFDNDSAIAELHFFGVVKSDGDRFKFPPIQLGRYFEEDSEKVKSDMLVVFVKAMSEHQQGIGYITITTTAEDLPAVVQERERRLLDDLKKKGINCNRISLVNGGVGPLAGAGFTVVHKSFLDDLGMKPECS